MMDQTKQLCDANHAALIYTLSEMRALLGGAGGSDAETERLRRENASLATEVQQLQAQLLAQS